MNGGAKIFRCSVEKILNFINEWRVSKIIVKIICRLLLEGRRLFSQFDLFCIGLIVLLGSKLKLILFHVLISERVVKSPYAVGINRAKHPSLRFLDKSPVFVVYQRFLPTFLLPHNYISYAQSINTSYVEGFTRKS